MLSIFIILILGYFTGSIPTSIIAGKLLRGIDIREHGSGNPGATNVFRVLGWKAGVVVGLLDLAKGFIATVYISRIAFGEIPVSESLVQILAGLAAVCGHVWTVFAGFRGGKGVLTAAGMFFGLAPGTTLVCIVVFCIAAFPTRYVSLGSISAAVTLAVIMSVRKFIMHHEIEMPLLIFTLIISLLIIYTHRSNIKRLINGTENKFTWK
ncbi:hypothetical protein AMJ80_00770 [bacterium SM23_31]|nr:MAG: hypothetical protein AMJ80_00770 [bacterium SM23_31]